LDLLSDFEVYLLGKGFSPATVRVYRGHLRRFVAWHEAACGRFDLRAVTPLDVADYRRHLQGRGRKPTATNNALAALRSLFVWAASRRLVDGDPVEGVKRLPEEASPARWLARRDLGALVRAVYRQGGPRDQALVVLLLHTGLRVSEAVSLRRTDVVINDRSGHVVVRMGKGGRSRQVPLNVTARKPLAAYMGGLEGEWLFPGRGGGPMTSRATQKILAKYARLAGVEATPHRLRHSFCKLLVEAGESLDVVAALAGHGNLNTTARYTRPGVRDMERAVEKLAWE